jgi:hypothetical protein
MSGSGTGTVATVPEIDRTEAPSYNNFILAFPAFASLTIPIVNSALSFSSRFLSRESWGSSFFDAVGLDAAHNLALQGMTGIGSGGAFQGAVGPVTSVSAAGVSTSFASPDMIAGSKSDSWYSKTVYGQMFLRLRDNVMPMGFMCS